MYEQAAYNLAIGITLQQLHREQKIQREQIADKLEISELAVSHIETGGETLSAGGMILLLEVFGLSWDEFMERVRANLPEAQKRMA